MQDTLAEGIGDRWGTDAVALARCWRGAGVHSKGLSAEPALASWKAQGLAASGG